MSKRFLVGAIAGLGLLATAAILGMAMVQSAAAGVQALELQVTPETDTNMVDTEHTVTATVELNFEPLFGADVTFDVISGPNTGTSMTCTPNADCSTDETGQVSGTYPGDGGAGMDTIEVCVVVIADMSGAGVVAAQQPTCVQVEKEWVEPTPTPTPTATATATPTPTPTATPPVAEAPDILPPTGSQPASGSDFPWAVVALAVGGLLTLLAGGALLRKRAR